MDNSVASALSAEPSWSYSVTFTSTHDVQHVQKSISVSETHILRICCILAFQYLVMADHSHVTMSL